MKSTWRITALAILLGFLALPSLGLLSGDTCCAGGSPCAPGAAPCTTLGPTPCCDADRSSAGVGDVGRFGPPLALLSPAGWLAALGRPNDPAPPCAPGRSVATRALRLSVVLRI